MYRPDRGRLEGPAAPAREGALGEGAVNGLACSLWEWTEILAEL